MLFFVNDVLNRVVYLDGLLKLDLGLRVEGIVHQVKRFPDLCGDLVSRDCLYTTCVYFIKTTFGRGNSLTVDIIFR